MKKLLLILLTISFSSFCIGQNEEVAAIESVLTQSYVQAVFVDFNETSIRDGFYKDFQFHFPMMSPSGRSMKKVVLDEWIKMIANMKFGEIDSKILEVHQSGNAASTVSEIYQDGKKLYTDYMVWRKIEGKWMIMGKTYDMHQKRMRK